MSKISDNTIYLFFAIMALTEISSQFLLKKGSAHKDYLNLYFFLGLIAIFITYVFLYLVMRTGKHLSVIHATHHTFIIIALSLGSYFLFSQTLNNSQMIGLIAVIIGTIILSLNEENHSH
jgi:multidrug transporter EmrE-like cation transporter